MQTVTFIPRPDVEALLDALTGANCAALIGLSNMGKSTLLRALSDEAIASRYQAETGRQANLIYVDCNRMFDLTDQGFYELILRAISESIQDLNGNLQAQIQACYESIVRPDTPFDVPLNFNKAMTAILEQSERDIILLLDEFDEAFAALDGRVFLNLRALRDKYRSNLSYVTANVRHLGTFRTTSDVSEFVELSAAHIHVLGPLNADATRQVVQALTEAAGQTFTDDEIAFLLEESGGHPGLIEAATLALLRQPEAIRQESPQRLREILDHDMIAASECIKLWRQLLVAEQEACLEMVSGDQLSEHTLQPLLDWGLVHPGPDGQPVYFSALFERFVRRQTLYTEDIPAGLVIDADAGDVWVDGRQVPPLTDLEFRLLLLLYERLDKLTDKFQIVEAVWGIDYLDEVDDSRIEKLVSRLRAKVEPDPSNPRYLTTIRGRGYKLATS